MEEAPAGKDRVVWLGHASVRIDLDGSTLLIDPLARQRIAHIRRHAPAVEPAMLAGTDAILITHLHLDHLDFPTLKGIGRDTPLVVPRGAGSLFARRRFRNVTEVAVGDQHTVGRLLVEAVHALHGGSRPPWPERAPALGYVVRGSSSVFHLGDTDVYAGLADLRCDIALVPIWGWGARLGPGHMNPARAAEAVTLIAPKAVIPIHYGTYATARPGHPPPYLTRPLDEFRAALAEHGDPAELRVVAVGESSPIP